MAEANYVDRVAFPAIVRIARQHGDNILVGFDGGRALLRRMPTSDLLARQYKYDWTARPTGVKDRSNWIPGNEFVEILTALGIVSDQ